MLAMTLIRISSYLVYILFLLLLSSGAWAYNPDLQIPQKYSGDKEIAGWYMSEKLDGIRGYWDGERLLGPGIRGL